MTDTKKNTSSDSDIHTEHKEWDEVSCPICMDHPHNAVLLICSSYEKGCRSYICDTSYRHSNCLDRFKKMRAYGMDNPSQSSSAAHQSSDREGLDLIASDTLTPEPNLASPRIRRGSVETDGTDNFMDINDGISASLIEALEGNNYMQESDSLWDHVEESVTVAESSGQCASETNCLKCPLCRGKVMDWMIVKEAREYLDLKPRSCSCESCSFSGNYRELRRHARRDHPMTRPADVDPLRLHAWRRLERQRDYGDILSAIRSAIPGSVVLGDYVVDNRDGLRHDQDFGDVNGPWWTTFFLFHMIGAPFGSLNERRGSRTWRRHRHSSGHRNLWGENLLGLHDDEDGYRSLDDGDIPIPRRRRGFMRSEDGEELP